MKFSDLPRKSQAFLVVLHLHPEERLTDKEIMAKIESYNLLEMNDIEFENFKTRNYQ